jgi:glutamine cyclotransferase
MKRAAIYLGLIALVSGSALALAGAEPGPEPGPEPGISYKLLHRYPHDRSSFTQGLEIHRSMLYESTGLYGKSTIRYYPPDTPADMTLHRLTPDRFGEGLTLLNDKLYQLSWRSGDVFVYDPDSLSPVGKFSIDTDGWGLTNNGSELIYSDGSDTLFFLDATTHTVIHTVTVRYNGNPLKSLNELEWIDGLIFANVLPTDTIVIIDPSSGSVVDSLDIGRLYPRSMRPGLQDIANGIAWDREARELLVTGKNWPWLYRLKLFNKPQKDSH